MQAATSEVVEAESVVVVVVAGLSLSDARPERMPALVRIMSAGSVLAMHVPAESNLSVVAALLTGTNRSAPEPTQRTEVGLPDDAWTVADAVRCAGGRTALFSVNGWIQDRTGFRWGWDQRVNYLGLGLLEWRIPFDDRTVVADALSWIREQSGERLFAFLYLMGAHRVAPRGEVGTPEWFAAHDPMSASDALALSAAHDRSLATADAALDALVRGLSDLGRARNTLLVVTSAGAAQLDGRDADATSAAPADVPLIFRGPGRPEPEVGHADAIDLMPTVLEAMDIVLPPTVAGVSLGPERRSAPAALRVPASPLLHELSREECVMVANLGYGGDPTRCTDYPAQVELDARRAELERARCPGASGDAH